MREFLWTYSKLCIVTLHYYSAHSPLGFSSDRLHQDKYYDYLCYLLSLSLDYLSFQQLRYYFLSCVYPQPTLSTFPVGGNRCTRRKPKKTKPI